jgi:cytochrome b561
MTPDTPGYSLTARTFHWTTAVLVLAVIPLGILMGNVGGGPLQDFLFNLHRSIGAVLLPIAVARLLYRIGHPPPPLPAEMPAIQAFAAHFTHAALYIFLIVQPILGWVATSAYRAPISVFWLFTLPPIWPENRGFSERLFGVHKVVGITMAVLLIAHVGAALFHHFIRKDDILLRMLRGR